MKISKSHNQEPQGNQWEFLRFLLAVGKRVVPAFVLVVIGFCLGALITDAILFRNALTELPLGASPAIAQLVEYSVPLTFVVLVLLIVMNSQELATGQVAEDD